MPECQTVINDIKPYCLDKGIIDFYVSDNNRPPSVLRENLLGRQIKNITRHGKYIIFNLNKGFLVSHLRMTGQWYKDLSGEYFTNKHLRWAIQFNDAGWLSFIDIRRFGTLNYYDKLEDCSSLNLLGVDGLELNDYNVQLKIQSAASKSNKPIKNFMMDQSIIAGSGNIYNCESLWEAMVHPKRKASQVVERIPEICVNLYKLFVFSIENKGSSISDYQGGSFQNYLNVYGQEGLPCSRCGVKIKRIVQAGRSTFFCSNCQY